MQHKKIELKLIELNNYYKTNNQKDYSSLFGGQLGTFLFRVYYQKYCDINDDSLEKEIINFINEEFNSSFESFGSFSISNGITGFSWFLQHLQTEGFLDIDDDIFNELDDLIYTNAKRELTLNENHDFMHGALGNMLYLSNRSLKSKTAKRYIIELVNELDLCSTKNALGKFWYESDYSLLDDEKNSKIINLNLSHGQASKIVVLSKLLSNNVIEAKSLLIDSVDFMINNRLKNNDLLSFPPRIVNGHKEAYNHSGWCRGDLAMSISLIKASGALKDLEIKELAINVALQTTKITTFENANITDANLCHGSSGLAHMYNRLFSYTGLDVFKEQSTHWIQESLKIATNNDGIAGFKTWDNLDNNWVVNSGFLNGTAGVGLAMLSHISKKHINWDECILLS